MQPPFFRFPSPRIHKAKWPLGKQLTLFSPPPIHPTSRIGHRDISPLCLIIRRQSDGERAAFDLHSLLHPFNLFRRLISCLVEDVVVAISFASRGAWATSSMKWTTCPSYGIWLAKSRNVSSRRISNIWLSVNFCRERSWIVSFLNCFWYWN